MEEQEKGYQECFYPYSVFLTIDAPVCPAYRKEVHDSFSGKEKCNLRNYFSSSFQIRALAPITAAFLSAKPEGSIFTLFL